MGYSTLGLRAQHAFDDVTLGAALAFASTGISFAVTGVPLAELLPTTTSWVVS